MEARREPVNAQSSERPNGELRVVVAGPSSNVTIPGLMTAEVVGALTTKARVTKVPVNPNKDFDSGLHRAKSLSAMFRSIDEPEGAARIFPRVRQRQQSFRQHFNNGADMAVALAWPGLSNSWIGEFVDAARQVGAQTVVLIVSHPSQSSGAASIAREVANSDLVLVGDIIDATLLSAALGTNRPVIEVHRSLSLTGRNVERRTKRLTTFLPKDDEQALLSVLTAFDAIPTDWVEDYDLRVIMRYSGQAIPDRVAASHHADRVSLIGESFSGLDMHQLATESSAISVTDPEFDSRAFATAVEEGVATVVLASGMSTGVGEGYVGGLLADINRPTSVFVAHNHALRLSDLRFPGPQAWFELAERLLAEVDRENGEMSYVSSRRFSE